MRLELINRADVAGQQLQSTGISAAGGELEQREADADKLCSLHQMTDFEKISALLSLLHSSNTVCSNSSCPALENHQAQDDEDSCTKTEPNLDDEQELSALAQRQPSAFHTAMSHKVCVVIFFFMPQTHFNFYRGHLGKNQHTK